MSEFWWSAPEVHVIFIYCTDTDLVKSGKDKDVTTDERKLIKAIKNHEFMPFFQPIVSNCENKVAGCEIFIRWLDNKLGLIDAMDYIDIINESDLLIDIIQEVIVDFFDDLDDTGRKFRNDFFVTMNIMPEMLISKKAERFLSDLIRNSKNKGLNLIFEVTEKSKILHHDNILKKIKELMDKGIMFAVDDYGAGYSAGLLLSTSLPKIIKTDANKLSLKDEKHCRNFFRETVRIASMIKATVIAEGVETKEQENMLLECGVHLFQGYRYGPSVPFGLFCYQSNPWENRSQNESLLPIFHNDGCC